MTHEQIDDAGLSDTMVPTEPDGGGPGCWPPMSALFPTVTPEKAESTEYNAGWDDGENARSAEPGPLSSAEYCAGWIDAVGAAERRAVLRDEQADAERAGW